MAMRSILHSSSTPVTPAPYGLYNLHAGLDKNDQLSAEEIARRKRVLGRFPTLQGRYDFASFQERDSTQFKRFQDSGDQRAKSPFRNDNPFTDTASHYPSPAAEAITGEFHGYIPLTNTAQENRPGSSVPSEADTFAGTTQRKEVARQFKPWSAPKEELLEDASISAAQRPQSKYPIDILNDKELRNKVASRAFYKTTTQKLYEGVDWSERIRPPPPPPGTTYERRSDLVSRQIKRYNNKAEPWQNLSKTPFSWDYHQTRNRPAQNGPLSFTSENTKGEQIPDYTGVISGEGEKDVTGLPFRPYSVVRSGKPRYADSGRRGYIPGYQGCTHWSASTPPLSQEREPRAESSARAHRPFTYPINDSVYSHQAPVSRLVSLSHPFNPNNSTEPRLNTTASGLKVR